MRWSQDELDAFYAKSKFKPEVTKEDLDTDAKESELQSKIEAWCKERGYFHFHDRSRKVNTPGMPDLVIALPGGKTLWCELKRPKGGKVSVEQQRVILRLNYLGHCVVVVNTFKGFLREVMPMIK